MIQNKGIVMEQLQEVRNSVVTNKFVGKFIAACVSVMTACMIGILAFLAQLKEDVPLLKQQYHDVREALGTVQNSVNSVRLDQQASKEAQIRMDEQLKIIKEKIQ